MEGLADLKADYVKFEADLSINQLTVSVTTCEWYGIK